MADARSIGPETLSVRVRPELHQLAVFLAVIENQSFAGAARQLGRTQPAISQSIARLEQLYGGNLFRRRPGAALSLTPLGEAILPSAEQVLFTIDQQMAEAAQLVRGKARVLGIGLHRTAGSPSLQRALTRFVADRTSVELRFVEASPGELLDQLHRGLIDLTIMPKTLEDIPKSMVRETLWHERLAVALPVNHALTSLAALTCNQACQLPLMMSVNDLYLDRPELGLRHASQVTRHRASSACLVHMVALGLGATILFASEESNVPGVVFTPLKAGTTVPIEVIWEA